MAAYRFSVRTRFWWEGAEYEVTQRLGHQQLNLQNASTGEVRTVALSTLIAALHDNTLRFTPRADAKRKEEAGQRADEALYETLDQYPAYALQVAEYRLAAIKPLIDLPPSQRTRQRVRERADELRAAQSGAPLHIEAESAASEGPSKRQKGGCVKLTTAADEASLFRWKNLYESSNRDLRSLIPATERCGGQTRLPAEVEAIIDEVIQERYLVPEATSIGAIYHIVAARFDEAKVQHPEWSKLKYPSRSTVRRRIEALDPVAVYAARFGKEAARLRFKQYYEGPQAHVPHARVEIDTTRPDLILVTDGGEPIGRPWLTSCLDCATDYPLGYCLSWEPPSYLTVMACLYHAVLKKDGVREKYGLQHDWLAYGIPTLLVTDRGREYVGNDLKDACYMLGIELEYCPPRSPHRKGCIERGWRTLNTKLLHRLPSITFSNPVERGDYDSVGLARVRLSDIDRLLHMYFVDIYAESEHRTPHGPKAVPARVYERALETGWEPRLPESARHAHIALCRTAERAVEHYGVDLLGLRYNSDELGPLRAALAGRKAKVKWNPSDLGSIYVHGVTANEYIAVPVLDSFAMVARGKSLWQYRVIRRVALEQGDQADAAGSAARRRPSTA